MTTTIARINLGAEPRGFASSLSCWSVASTMASEWPVDRVQPDGPLTVEVELSADGGTLTRGLSGASRQVSRFTTSATTAAATDSTTRRS